MRRGLTLTAWALLLVAVPAAHQNPPPQFRSGVTITHVDVTVLDRRTRQPVRGLTARDFIVRVDGQTQPVTSVAEVTSPGARAAVQPGLHDAAVDVSTPRLAAVPLAVPGATEHAVVLTLGLPPVTQALRTASRGAARRRRPTVPRCR